MTRRDFLKNGAVLGGALATGAYVLFPEDIHAKIPADLKVTKLRVIPVWNGSMTDVFVKLFTNKGITGVGEGSIRGREGTNIAAIREHARYIEGKNPLDIEKHWQAMYRQPRWRGGPILNAAVSAVDIALWDIAGKVLDVPVYQLLGGAVKNKIRLYVYGSNAEDIRRVKEAGWTACKTGLSGIYEWPWKLKDNIQRIKEMREAAGDDFDILIDGHTSLKPEMALELCRRVEEYRPFWIEEPMLTSDLGKMQWLADHVNVPICQGESTFTIFGFQEIIDRHLANILNPDVTYIGGISQFKKIAAMAEAHFIDVSPHNATSPVMTLANLHISAYTTNCVIQEFNQAGKYTAFQEELYNGVHIKYSKGYAELPPGPGLGIDINEEAAKKQPGRPFIKNRGDAEWPDGSVADT